VPSHHSEGNPSAQGLWWPLGHQHEVPQRAGTAAPLTTDTPPAHGRRIGNIVMDVVGTESPFAPALGAETSGRISGPIIQTEVIWAINSCRQPPPSMYYIFFSFLPSFCTIFFSFPGSSLVENKNRLRDHNIALINFYPPSPFLLLRPIRIRDSSSLRLYLAFGLWLHDLCGVVCS